MKDGCIKYGFRYEDDKVVLLGTIHIIRTQNVPKN